MKKELIYSSSHGFKLEKLKLKSELLETEVLVLPKRVGICGSDFFAKNKYTGEKLRLGHEWVGVVESSQSNDFKKGDLVTSTATWGCGKCEYCQSGQENKCLDNILLGSEAYGMLRTHAIIESKNLIKLDMKDLDAAALLEVAAIGYTVIENLKKFSLEKKSLLILGAGSVGIMSALSAKEQGIAVDIVDNEIFRVKRAQSMGLNAKHLGELLTSREKYDIIADCTGDSNGKTGGWNYLKTLVRVGAEILIVGHYESKCEFDSHLYGKFSLNIKWMRGMPKEMYLEAIEFWSPLIEKYKADIVTGVFDLEQSVEAFNFAQDRSQSIKTLIKMND